jgi:UDP-3-O-[3-hydroxymyristoyl] glucosamine N-acyltransferase
LGSEVRIGALVTVDRGVFEDTTIGSQSAIDNLVQIAHNCELGAGSIICALCALAGSTTTGENVTLAGMVGTKGHLHIGEGAVVAAQSGVTKDIPPGSMVKGYPPRPMAEALEIQALTTRLPELYRRLKDLEAMISRNS